MKFIPALLLLTISAKAQVIIDTLPNAKAYQSTYVPIYQYGVMSNGHPYAIGLTLSLNPQFPYWITRTDLVTKQVTKKTLDGTISYPLGYWTSMFDSSGNFVFQPATTDYHIRLINFKEDSITVTDLGLPFKDANGNFVEAIVYSMYLSVDGNIYFGAKGNPYYSWYDHITHTMHYSTDAINDIGIDWVLSIAGDANYVYAVTGQKDSCNFWAIRKSDNRKFNINRVPSYTRQTIYCGNAGVFFRDPYVNCFYKLINGTDTLRVPYPESTPTTYYEVNKGGGSPTVSSFFDKATSKIFYTVNGVSNNADVPTNFNQTNIQLVMTDKYDANRLYFVGSLYGDFFGYDIAKDSAWGIGHTNYNLYSWKRLNDSIYLLGNYPGGVLIEWNTKQAWTAETYVNGQIIHTTDTFANPHILIQFKSTDAAFSHLSTMLIDTIRHLVIGGGDVIRIDSSASIGVYNYTTDSGYGYGYNKIGKLTTSSITQYGDLIIYSTAARFANNDTAKIYFYNPLTNTMVDSIGFGLTDYGGLWVQGDQLLGHAGTTFYKINLSTKKLIYRQTGTATSVIRLQDGKFVCNGTCPAGWGECKTMSTLNNFVGIGNGTYYSVNGIYVIRHRNLATETIDLNTAAGKEKYIINLLYNK